jgi:hypothetical protein
MTTLPLQPTITAPAWEDDPIGWAVWTLENHAAIYDEFAKLAENRLRRKPGSALSANQLIHVLRWETEMEASGDYFKINDHAAPLYARLFVLEHPWHEGCFRNRKSIFDTLSERDTQRLKNALREGRKNDVFRGTPKAQ